MGYPLAIGNRSFVEWGYSLVLSLVLTPSQDKDTPPHARIGDAPCQARGTPTLLSRGVLPPALPPDESE